MPPASIFTVLVRMVTGFVVFATKESKSAFVCDNAHALDLQTWTALRSIFKRVEKNMLLVLAKRSTARDESIHKIWQWFLAAPATLCLHLSELSKSDASALASAVLQVNVLPRPLATALFEKCRGHPRFISEVCELLLAEEKIIVEGGSCRVEKDDYENLALPDNIRAVFVSRIDQLSSSEQITLKVASVIGPVFSLTLVCDIHPSGANKLQVAVSFGCKCSNQELNTHQGTLHAH